MVWFHVALKPDGRRDSKATGPRRCPWNCLSSLCRLFKRLIFLSLCLTHHRGILIGIGGRSSGGSQSQHARQRWHPKHQRVRCTVLPQLGQRNVTGAPRSRLPPSTVPPPGTGAPQAMQTGQRSMAGLVRWAAAPVVVDTPPLRTRDPLGPGRRGRKTATGWLRPRRPRPG